MPNNFTRRGKIERAERSIGGRPDPNGAEYIRESFDTVELMDHLRSCGCKAAAEACDLLLEYFVHGADRSEKTRKLVERKLDKLDKRIWKWQEANPELWMLSSPCMAICPS